jgi:GTP-binding protein Era
MCEAPERRCAIIALIGAPNAGKSTLVNALVGQKVAIVTHKVQTTRATLRAVAMAGESQLIFVDTPGIFSPAKRLERAMVAAAWGGARDADIIVLIVDAASRARRGQGAAIARRLADEARPRILVLNKIDLIDRPRLLELAAEFAGICPFERTFMVSARSGDGVEDLKAHLARTARPGPFLFPPDQLTDLSERMLAAEITREKLYLRLHDELPYALRVVTESWAERKDGSVRIEQVITVERESQRRILLGKGGRRIKEISIEARTELGRMLERPVHLFLFVKVRPKWSEDPASYREIGLEFEPRD